MGEYPGRLLSALQAAAPDIPDDEATVVVLTPGRYNSAYFEHSLLARTMGVDLVEASDLVERNERIYMRTTAGLRRVDVIYKRTDDDFIDPEVFRPDSMLGVPGLVRAVLAGNVVVANGIGNGIGDDKLTYTYVPDLIRYYLCEEPILPNVDTWRLEESESRAEVLDRLEELVVKPVDGSGGKGIVIGPAATTEELDALRARLQDDPRGWIAQPVVQLSTIPTLVESGPRAAPRRIFGPFALNSGDDVWVLPGGLTRVALPRGRDDRELLARRRFQGHLGARRDRAAGTGRGSLRTAQSQETRGRADRGSAGRRLRRVRRTCPRTIPRSRRGSPIRSPSARIPIIRTSTFPSRTATRGPMMLSRIADSMFWIGRYVERADQTARILDVTLQSITEDASEDVTAACAGVVRDLRLEQVDDEPTSPSSGCSTGW